MSEEYFGIKVNPTRLRSMSRIVATLLDMLKEMPFDKISVAELCSRAGLTRKTFYKHFDSKTAVVEAALDSMFFEFTRRFNFADAKPRDVIMFGFEYFNRERRLGNIFTCRELFDVVTDKIKDYVELVYDDTLYNSRAFEPTLAEYYHDFISFGIVSIVRTWAEGGFKQPPKVMAALTARLLSGGIS